MLFIAALHLLDSKFEKKLVSVLFTIFGLVWIFQLSYFGGSASNSLADLTACISLTIVYSLVLYKSVQLNLGVWWKSPEIISSIGLLVYFAGSVPFVSMINYLARNEPKMYYVMYYVLNVGLANVRYILLFLSFVMIYRTKGKTQLQIA